MEVAVAAAPAPIAAVAVPAEDTPEAAVIVAAAEAVEAVVVEAAVLPPAEAADADKTKKDGLIRGHPFFEIVHQCTMLMGSEHVLGIEQFVQLLFAQQTVL